MKNKFLYVKQVEDFEKGNPREWVCLLLKVLYGLKAALALWQKTLHEYIFKMGFVPSPADPCLFIMGTVTSAIWVDDMLVYGPDEKDLDQVYEILLKQFKTKDLGVSAHFSGIQITRNRDQIIVS
jgi:hypothetical protein